MKVLLDTCVIYPTVMRQMVLGRGGSRAFSRRSGRPGSSRNGSAQRQKLGPEGVAQAQGRGGVALGREVAGRGNFLAADSLAARLWLPDPADVHVLAAAVAGSADLILTLNAKDFPRNVLAEEGLNRSDPDGFLHGIWQAKPELVADVAQDVLAEANRLSGDVWQMRALLKKARLPRLAKALSQD